MKQLERLLFLQGNRCFFCGQPILAGEASVEHLVAAANGAARALLNHGGSFACPMSMGGMATAGGEEASEGRIAFVVADLRKRGPARPRRVRTLKNTMNAAFQMSLSDAELNELLVQLQARRYVIVEDTKVSYALPAIGA